MLHGRLPKLECPVVPGRSPHPLTAMKGTSSPSFPGLTLVILIILSTLLPAHVPAAGRPSFTWTISDPSASHTGSRGTVSLAGSLHLLTRESFHVPKAMVEAYREARMVVFETDFDRMGDPATHARMRALGMYPEGQTLEQHVSPETFTLVHKRAVRDGIPSTHINQLKPWLCALSLAAVEFQRLGFHPQYGIDRYFLDKAKKDGRQRIFLETVDQQLQLFSAMPAPQQESFLRQTLYDLDLMGEIAPDIVRVWTTGDTHTLYELLSRSFSDYPDLYRRLFTERNRRWVPKLERLLGSRRHAFVVIGAGHLVGPEGLVSLLTTKGYALVQR